MSRHPGYRKQSVVKKLQQLIKNLPNLPLQPEEIHVVGSFLREGEYVGDVDLLVRFSKPTAERFEKFRKYFPLNAYGIYTHVDERYPQFHKLMQKKFMKLVMNLSDEAIQTISDPEKYNILGQAKKMSFRTFCDSHPEIRVIIEEEFNIDFDLLCYCSWYEVFGYASYGIGHLSLLRYFRRIFVGRKKGVELHTERDFPHGVIHVLIWSPKKPDFRGNYQHFLDHETETYIHEEYNHLFQELDTWIELYEDKAKRNPRYIQGVEQFTKLKQEFSVKLSKDETYASLSVKCSALREKMKKINDSIGH